MADSSPSTHKHHGTGLDAAIEIGENLHQGAEKVHGKLETGNKAFKFYSGVGAFRKYSWIRNAPIANSAGNFRGMVINSRWKAVYNVTLENAEKLEKAGQYLAIAGVALDIVKQHERISSIMNSRMDNAEKAQHLIALGSMAVFNMVGSPIPLAAHAIAVPLARACNFFQSTQSFAENVTLMDAAVQTSYKQLMDSENVVHYINAHLVIK
jgi:hypothetical protein